MNVKCVDVSQGMIDLCKEKGLDAEIMDIEDLKFWDGAFDRILAVTSLLHVPKNKISRVVEKLSGILKDKGVIYACVKEGEGKRMIIDKNDNSTKDFFLFGRRMSF